jgi:hypothetical protein
MKTLMTVTLLAFAIGSATASAQAPAAPPAKMTADEKKAISKTCSDQATCTARIGRSSALHASRAAASLSKQVSVAPLEATRHRPRRLADAASSIEDGLHRGRSSARAAYIGLKSAALSSASLRLKSAAM